MPQTIQNVYLDLNLAFLPNPVTGDISVVTDVDAVKQSVADLVQTQYYETPFHPEIGCNVTTMLFENMTSITTLSIQRSIQDVVTNFEPRVQLQNVAVIADVANFGYNVTITFYVLSIANAVTINFFLERLR